MWSVILIFAAFAAADDSPALRYQVTPEKIQPGEHATLEVKLRLAPGEAGADVPLPEVKDELWSSVPGLQIIERDFRKTDDDWIWRYEVTTYELGKLRLPPLEIRRKGENFSTEASIVEVATTRTDKDTALRPEFGTLSRPFRWGLLFWFLVFTAALAGIAWYVRKHWDRWRRQVKLPIRLTPPPPVESPEAWLRRELQRISERLGKPDVNDVTHIIDELGLAWRGYFARRSAVPAEAWTSFEMLTRLTSDPRAKSLYPLWIECDHYKFAGQVGDPKNLAKRSIEESERVLLNVAVS